VSLGSESNSTAKIEDTSALQYKKTFLERERFMYLYIYIYDLAGDLSKVNS
jgi:hypothetical protein